MQRMVLVCASFSNELGHVDLLEIAFIFFGAEMIANGGFAYFPCRLLTNEQADVQMDVFEEFVFI